MTEGVSSLSWKLWALAALLAFAAALRIVAAYPRLSQTYDEPAHIACGMEWLAQGTYHLERQHPPMARLGILPFFLILIVALTLWTGLHYGQGAAVASVLLFSTLPPVLAHSGLATTDIPVTAALCVSLVLLWRWLNHASAGNSVLLGLSAGVAFLTKFSALLFLPVCAAASVWLLRDRTRAGPPRPLLKNLSALMVVAAAASFVVFATYRFSFVPFHSPVAGPYKFVDRLAGSASMVHDAAYSLLAIPVPAPDFFEGIAEVWSHARAGHRVPFLGKVWESAPWYFFPVTLAVKTPLPFLILAGLGTFLLCGKDSNLRAAARLPASSSGRPTHADLLLAPVCAAVILAVSMCSPIGVGVRHILPVYFFLAVPAGRAAARLASRARGGRVALIFLLAWQVVASVRAHPNTLAYFNELAGADPENIVGESDLDWGQDLPQLEEILHGLGVREFSIAYFGSADLSRHGLSSFRLLQPRQRTTGWVAVSVRHLIDDFSQTPPYDGYGWLREYQPVAVAGKTIRLYFVPGKEAVGHPSTADEVLPRVPSARL